MHAVVAGVGHVHAAVGRDGDRPRAGEPARSTAVAAPGGQQFAGGVELLHAVGGEFDGVDGAVAADGETAQPQELPRLRSPGPERVHELAVRGELLHAVVVGIGNVEKPGAVDGNVRRREEFPRLVSARTDQRDPTVFHRTRRAAQGQGEQQCEGDGGGRRAKHVQWSAHASVKASRGGRSRERRERMRVRGPRHRSRVLPAADTPRRAVAPAPPPLGKGKFGSPWRNAGCIRAALSVRRQVPPRATTGCLG